MNILLVDDESYVIDYLLAAVDWEAAGIEDVYYAYSALEALSILDEKEVDIVLTDVKMPGMSGLELIRRLNGKKIKCIVLSGHADFEYAQQAMKHQAVNYLLKPARAEDVQQEVKQVAAMIREEWHEISSVQNAMRSLREHEPLLRQNFLRELWRGQVPNEEMLRKKMEQLRIPLSAGGNCRLLVVRADGEFLKFGESTELADFAIDNIVSELLSEHFDFATSKDELGNRIYIVKSKATTSEQEDSRSISLEQTGSTIVEKVSDYLQGSISLMVGRVGKFPIDIPLLYEASLRQLRLHVRTSGGLWVDEEGGDDKRESYGTPLEQLYAPPSLLHLLEGGNWDRCVEKMKAIIQDIEQRDQVTAGHLLEAYHSMANAFFYIIHKSGRQPEQLLGASIYRSELSEKAASLSALEGWAFRAFAIIREALETKVSDDRSVIIDKVHRFVNRHLNEDVSLQSLADNVYLHPAYLSSVYKEWTGEGVSQYIYRRKMEHAAELLRKSNRKINEIAEDVGYQNTSYFIRVFKKYYACTPQKYREQ
ncbi:response regulator [Paenibacillus sp. strain BS8-2]